MAEGQGVGIADGDIVMLTQKIVSKSGGMLVELSEVDPSDFAVEIANRTDGDPRHVEVILREAGRIVKMRGRVLIVETKHGFVCANEGADYSNVGGGLVSLLPEDPDASARKIRDRINDLTGKDVAVIISDT